MNELNEPEHAVLWAHPVTTTITFITTNNNN